MRENKYSNQCLTLKRTKHLVIHDQHDKIANLENKKLHLVIFQSKIYCYRKKKHLFT